MNLRLVFDTNCIVSALLFEQGKLAWLRAFWQAGKHRPLASTASTKEIIRVLAYPKFKLGSQHIEQLLAEYLPFVESIEMPEHMPHLPQCRDRHDQMFIELAAIGKADVLISGDNDLLVMDEACTFSIESPAHFLARFNP